MAISHNENEGGGSAALAKKLGQKGPQIIKIREKIEIQELTSVSLQRNVPGVSDSTNAGGGKCLQIMLRATSNRMRHFVLSTDEQRLQMCWALRQAFTVYT